MDEQRRNELLNHLYSNQQPVLPEMSREERLAAFEQYLLGGGMAQAQTQPIEQSKPESAGFFGNLADVAAMPLKAAGGLVSTVGGLINPQGSIRKAGDDFNQWVEEHINSDEYKYNKIQDAKRIAEAEKRGESGWGARWENFKTNPLDTSLNVLESALPTIGAAVATGPIGAIAVGAAQGAGETRKEVNDHIMQMSQSELEQSPIYQQLRQQGLTPEQARIELATSWTEHGGEIATNALTGAVLERLGGAARIGRFAKPAGNFLDKPLVKFGTEVATETADEVLQQGVTNKAIQDVDSSRSLTHNLGGAAFDGMLGGHLGGAMAAADSYLRNRNEPTAEQKSEQFAKEASNPPQPQGVRSSEKSAKSSNAVDEQVLESVLANYKTQVDEEQYQQTFDELKSDIEEGLLAERANSQTEYGKWAQAYLAQTGQATQPQATTQTDADPNINPELERAIELRRRMKEWRTGKKVDDISDLLDTPMSFVSQDAKRDFALNRGWSEIQAIAQKYGIDPNDGKAMYQWLDDYAKKRDQAKVDAKASREETYRAKYDDFLGLSQPQADVAVQGGSSEQKSAKNEPITPEKVVPEIRQPTTAQKGASTQIQLGSQGEQQVDYELVEADELSVNLKPNVYQNRDRTSTDSQMQINEYARNLNPKYLGASVDVTQGAPTVDERYGVFAGNGRLSAIQQAYAKHPEKAAQYKGFLSMNAAEFGFNPQQVNEMHQPVLVRKVNGKIDVAKAVEDGNFNTGLDKGVLGDATANAKYLTPDLLRDVQINEDGTLNLSDSNTPFIQGLVGKIPVEQRPKFFAEQRLGNQSAYTLTAQGKEMVENALLVKAFSDPNNPTYSQNLLTDLIVSTDESSKRVKNALISVAGKVIQTKGNPDFDISGDIAQAYALMRQGKQDGRNVDELLSQQDFVNPPSKRVQGLTRLFYSPKSVREVQEPLNAYFDSVINSNLDQTQQDSMFGDELAIDRDELMNQAGISYSKSPMKSVEANIARGRKAMTKAILEKNSVHRAMYNPELDGWVDFEWGDTGQLLVSGKTKGAMGIAHIIESRMRKDNMNYAQVTRMLTERVVDTIAKGQVSRIYESGKVKSVFIEHNGNRATLIKREGSNSWLMNAFELKPTDEQVGSNDPNLPTQTLPTRQRQDLGAVGANNVQQSAQQSNTAPEVEQAKTLLRGILGDALVEQIQFTNSQNVTDPNPKQQQGKRSSEGFAENGQATLVVDNITAGTVLNRSQRLAWVAWHELAHAGIEVKYGKLFENMLNYARTNPVVNVIANRIAKEYAQDGFALKEHVATEEAIVELYAAAQTGNWAEIENRYGLKVHHSWKRGDKSVLNLLARIADRLRKFINVVTGADVQNASDQDVLNVLRKVKRSVRELEKNAQSKANEDVRYSLNEKADSAFAKAVDEVFNSQDDRFDNSRWIDLGTTPDALIQSGIDDKVMKINFAKIAKIKNDHPEMTADLLKQIPRELNNPVAVFKNTKGKPNSYVVLTELTVKGNERVIAALHADQEVGGLVFHKLASAYGKDGTRAYLENMIEKSDIRFVDKQKASRINSKLQLLAEDTIDLLFNKASVVKNDSNVNEAENLSDSDTRYSRKRSALETIQSGKVESQPSFIGNIKQGGFGQWWKNTVNAKVDYLLADETRPIADWVDTLDLARPEQEAILSSLDRADGIRQDLNAKVTQKFLKPLMKNIADLAKKKGKDVEFTKVTAEYWRSAQYAIIRNEQILERERLAMEEAKADYDQAKQSGNLKELERAETAYRRAERQYRHRKHDVELDNWERDEHGNYKVKRKVGVAGWSIPHAKAIIAAAERHFTAAEMEAALKPLQQAVEWNIQKNLESNRITLEQAKEYRRNPFYVPLTGDPDATDTDDFIGGASRKGVNTSKDKAQKGRTNSEAEGAIDAIYKMLDKTIANAAWQPFKNHIDDVWQQKMYEAKQSGLSELSAKEKVAEETGIKRNVMKGTTRTSDNVLIRKFNNVYYEYHLPEAVIKAIKGSQRNETDYWYSKVTAPLRVLTGWFARGVTQWNPAFAPKNMIRDVWEKSTVLATREIMGADGKELSQKVKNRIANKTFSVLWNPFEAKRLMKATGRLAKGDTENLDPNDEIQADLKQLIELGGVSNYSTMLARTEKELVDEIKKLNNPRSRVVDGAAKLTAFWNGTFDYVSSLAAFRALKQEGVPAEHAAHIVLNLTNFRKQGALAKHFKVFYMFLNPTLQGGKNLIQMLSTTRGKVYVAGRTVFAMALWSLLLSLDDEDDEGGKRMFQNGDLSREILIPTGEKDRYIRIPVGYGAPQVVNNLATNLLAWWNGQIRVDQAAANILAHNMKSVMPVAPSEISAAEYPFEKLADTLTPTMLKSITQWITNRNAFGGQIKPGFVQGDKLRSQQSKSNTAQFWQDTAEWMYENVGVDFHPEAYKHIFDSYRGMMGVLGNFISAKIENPNREAHGRSAVIPVVNDFYGVKGENRVMNQYYEFKGEAENLMREYNYHKEKGTLSQWQTPEKMQIVAWNKRADSKINQIRKIKQEWNKANKAFDKTKSQLSDEARERQENALNFRLRKYNENVEKIQREMVLEWRKREGLHAVKRQ